MKIVMTMMQQKIRIGIEVDNDTFGDIGSSFVCAKVLLTDSGIVVILMHLFIQGV